MILSVVLAILIIGGAAAFSVMRNANGPSSSDPALAVLMPPSISRCTDSCIMVERKCSMCCDYVAIGSQNETLFNQMFDQTCSHYRGPLASPQVPSSVPQCVQGHCEMAPMSGGMR